MWSPAVQMSVTGSRCASVANREKNHPRRNDRDLAAGH